MPNELWVINIRHIRTWVARITEAQRQTRSKLKAITKSRSKKLLSLENRM